MRFSPTTATTRKAGAATRAAHPPRDGRRHQHDDWHRDALRQPGSRLRQPIQGRRALVDEPLLDIEIPAGKAPARQRPRQQKTRRRTPPGAGPRPPKGDATRRQPAATWSPYRRPKPRGLTPRLIGEQLVGHGPNRSPIDGAATGGRSFGAPYRGAVFTRPDDLTDEEIVDSLASGWAVTVQRVEYAAVGFGSHHWHAPGASERWFVSVDDLELRRRHATDTRQDAAARLSAALNVARSLRRRGSGSSLRPHRRCPGRSFIRSVTATPPRSTADVEG